MSVTGLELVIGSLEYNFPVGTSQVGCKTTTRPTVCQAVATPDDDQDQSDSCQRPAVYQPRVVFDFLRSVLGPGITVKVLDDLTVFLTTDRARVDINSQLSMQCNGAIIGYPWRIIARPPPILIPQDTIPVDVKDYDVYEAQNGTMVTLYYKRSHTETSSSGRWLLSTASGWDVGHYKWMGNKTYQECFDEAVAVSAGPVGINYDTLSPDSSYTFIFSHPSYHPVCGSPAAYYLGTPCDSITVPGIPKHPEDAPYSLTGSGFGYVFRSKTTRPDVTTDQTNQQSVVRHYIVESERMKNIRRLFNEFPYKNHITANNRLKYITLRAYLTPAFRKIMLREWPATSGYFAEYDTKLAAHVAAVCSILRRSGTTNDPLTRELVNQCRRAKINVNEATSVEIITDFFKAKKYLDLYVQFL